MAMLSLSDTTTDPAVTDTKLDSEITGFLLRTGPNPSSTSVADFLKLYNEDERNNVARALLAHGVPQASVSNALTWLNSSSQWANAMPTIGGVLALASAAASGYHGFKRHNGSIIWAATWFILGGLFPIFVPVVAVAQGFSRSKGSH